MSVDLNADFQRATARAKSAARKSAQCDSVTLGNDQNADEVSNQNRPDLPSDSDSSRCLPNKQVGGKGLEPLTLAV
jgi:hypothetical protein